MCSIIVLVLPVRLCLYVVRCVYYHIITTFQACRSLSSQVKMIYSQICTLNWWIFRSKKGPRFRPHRNPWHRGQARLFFLIVSRGWKRLERAIGHRLPIAFSRPRTRHLGHRLPIAFSRAWKKELGLPTTENIQGRWAPCHHHFCFCSAVEKSSWATEFRYCFFPGPAKGMGPQTCDCNWTTGFRCLFPKWQLGQNTQLRHIGSRMGHASRSSFCFFPGLEKANCPNLGKQLTHRDPSLEKATCG